MISFCDRAAQLAPYLLKNAPQIDFEGAFPTQEFDWLRETGLLRAEVATLPILEILKILWHIGRGNLAVGRLLEGHINALQLVHWFGNQAQKARYFADADDGKLFAVWNTQGENGVIFDGEKMSGSKTFCSGAGHVARPLVTGKIQNSGWQMAIVATENAALEIDQSWWKPLGMRASASFQTDFSGTILENRDFLGAPDDYYRQPAFSGGALRFCAVQLGGAAAIFEQTRRFLRASGRETDVFQRARVGQMAMKIQSGWNWLENAAHVWKNPLETDERESAQIVAFAALMRLASEEIGLETMRLSEQSVGARGLMRGEPFERMTRDLTMYLKQPHLDEIAGRAGKWALENQARADELWN